MAYLKNKKSFINRYRKIFGVLFIILGIAGLFLPFLQGIALILLGSYLVFGYKKVKRK